MRIVILATCLHILLQVNSQPVFHNDYYLKFDHLTNNNGLSNNYILDIFHDKYGYIWIATKDGLNKYNAYEFEVYRHDPNDTNSITNNTITSITEDKYGNLWVGTQNGLNIYNDQDNTFTTFNQNSRTKQKLADHFIRALYADRYGILWIETATGFLHKYYIEKDSLTTYKHNQPLQVNNYFYHQIYEDENGYIWLGGRNMGPIKFDVKSEQFFKILPDPDNSLKKREKDVSMYFIDSEGVFWVGGFDGLYTCDRKRGIFNKILRSSTYCATEDNQGKLWFGTGSGIFIYDNQTNTFTFSRHCENNPHSLLADHVNKLFKDRSGNIWIGTTEGISVYSPSKHKFRHIYHINGIDHTPSSNFITSVIQDKTGRIWIGTHNNGLDCFDSELNRIAHYEREGSEKFRIISNKISVLREDKKGNIWVGLWSGMGFNIIYPKQGKIEGYSILTHSFRADWYSDFLQDNQGNHWVSTWGAAGLYQFDNERGMFTDETFYQWAMKHQRGIRHIVAEKECIWLTPSNRYFKAYNSHKGKYNAYFEDNCLWTEFDHVYQVFRDRANNIWFATDHGLYHKTKDPYHKFKRYKHETDDGAEDDIFAIANSNLKDELWLITTNCLVKFNKRSKTFKEVCKHSIPHASINFIFEDSSKSLWIGTSEGVFCRNAKQDKLVKIIIKHPEIQNNEDQAVYCIHQPNSDEIWLGTSEGIFIYISDSNKFTQVPSLSGLVVYSIISGKSSATHLAGTNKGLVEYNNDRIINSYHTTQAEGCILPGDTVYSLEYDPEGNLWIGTNRGLCMMDNEDRFIECYNLINNKYISSRLTRCLLEDNEGNIWIGTSDKGLNKIGAQTGIIKWYSLNSADSINLKDDEVNCLLLDKKGNIWAGGLGLHKYLPEKDSFLHYYKSAGLSNNHIMGILEDNTGNLWISTQNGLSKFNPVTESFENFFAKDGLQNNEFTEACCKLHNGKLIFGGKNGFNLINPNDYNRNQYPPEVYPSRFMVFDKAQAFNFPATQTIELKHNQNYFTFELAALDFSDPLNNKFAYKLEGFDPSWFFTDASQRFAKYTNVAPGDYEFKVKAMNNDGIWNETGSSIEVIIHPPFWKTYWFISLEVFITLLILVALMKYREKNIKEKNKLLLMEQKLLRSQMNPHFIFNSLTSIQSYIFENNPIEAGSYLSRFSELIRSILDNSREEFITLEKEINTLKNYLDIQKLRYSNKFNYEIMIEEGIYTDHILVPPMLAQPFIENSIEHGFRNVKADGSISLQFSQNNGYLILLIIDNGMGIEVSKNSMHKSGKEHQSLAIIITRERISMLNKGRKRHKYSLHIEETRNAFGKTTGTRVQFSLPLIELNFQKTV